jgi:hypothetical protein
MNNEVLTTLENCKDFIEQIKDDSLAKYLIKEIDTTIENERICKDTIINETKMLVFNIDNLYKDLGTWIHMVKEGNAEMQQLYKNSIDKEIENNHCI